LHYLPRRQISHVHSPKSKPPRRQKRQERREKYNSIAHLPFAISSYLVPFFSPSFLGVLGVLAV
jgi:hypothetical protein